MNSIDILEIRRAVFHMLVGISIMLIILVLPSPNYFLFLILVVGILLSFLSTQYKLPLIHKSLCLFERKCNKTIPGKGVLFFFAGALLSIQLFDTQIALAAIIILTFADPASHFIGRTFGKITSSLNRKKKVEGTLTGILFGTFFASFFVPLWLAFIGSLFGMIAELAGMRMAEQEIDDNIVIPLVAGTIMHLVSLI
ncbi:MAG: hypothetical protein ABH840_01770 [Nanoarchaeota archaeon]